MDLETVPQLELLEVSPQEFAYAGLQSIRQRANYISTVIDANGAIQGHQYDLMSETILDLVEYGVRAYLLNHGFIDTDPTRSPYSILEGISPELYRTTWGYVLAAGQPGTDLEALAQRVMDFNETVMGIFIAGHWAGFEMSTGFLDRIFEEDFCPMIMLAQYLGVDGPVPESFIEEVKIRGARIAAAAEV